MVLREIKGFYGICDLSSEATPNDAAVLASKLLAGGASVLQLRQKKAPSGKMLTCARVIQPLCRKASVPFVVNDRLDVALLSGADGVHLGQEDLPLSVARALAPRLLIGISTHTMEQVREAVEGGADYIGFGPIFPTGSKERPDPVTGLEALRKVCTIVRIPVVAIGGITRETVPLVMEAGAAAVAVIGAVVRATDPQAAALEIARAARKW